MAVNPEFFVQIDKIIEKIVDNGNLVVTGDSVSLFWIIRRIRNHKKHGTNQYRTVTFDSSNIVKNNFDMLPYIDALNVDYESVIPFPLDLIVNMYQFAPYQRQDYFIKSLLYEFNESKIKTDQHKGVNPITTFFVVEDVDYLFEGNTLFNIEHGTLKNMMVNGKSVGIVPFCSCKTLDIPTVVFEGAKTFLFGGTTLETDLERIEEITQSRMMKDLVSKLLPREFIFYEKPTRDIQKIQFPMWNQNRKPYPYKFDSNKCFTVEV